MNTKILADKVVDALKARLCKCELPAFKSIYICGSYCRGDWLNCSRDLDIHMINDESGTEYRDENLKYIKSIVSEALEMKGFSSHCPGGIEYGFNDAVYIPKTREDALKPSPYAYFSMLMFDLKENHITVYGDEIGDLLPETPDPKGNAREWFSSIANRVKTIGESDIKLQFNMYKAILAAQLHFGEATVNKYRMLELYQKYVPDFAMKWFGELVIRNYIGSIYPDRVPVRFPHAECLAFIDELTSVVEK